QPGTKAGTIADATHVAAGLLSTCASRTNGQVMCWGRDTPSAQLGDGGSASDRTSPVSVGAPLTNVASIATMDNHTCVPMADGTQQCWGANGANQITSTAANPTTTPAAGYALTAPMGSNGIAAGTAKRGGDDASAQVGDNPAPLTGATRTSPTAVANFGTTLVKAITAGDLHACALLADTTVKCWGDNTHGQIGDNSTTLRKQ